MIKFFLLLCNLRAEGILEQYEETRLFPNIPISIHYRRGWFSQATERDQEILAKVGLLLAADMVLCKPKKTFVLNTTDQYTWKTPDAMGPNRSTYKIIIWIGNRRICTRIHQVGFSSINLKEHITKSFGSCEGCLSVKMLFMARTPLTNHILKEKRTRWLSKPGHSKRPFKSCDPRWDLTFLHQEGRQQIWKCTTKHNTSQLKNLMLY